MASQPPCSARRRSSTVSPTVRDSSRPSMKVWPTPTTVAPPPMRLSAGCWMTSSASSRANEGSQRHALLAAHEHVPPLEGHGEDGVQDRKSTRLNSSHANISYAVFCLKKKNNKNK